MNPARTAHTVLSRHGLDVDERTAVAVAKEAVESGYSRDDIAQLLDDLGVATARHPDTQAAAQAVVDVLRAGGR